ncbi:hypothetical protein ACH492_10715 [Streptomyces sp. NPDC019443]|uniref:hypothetical protein n=1 Tax=Streptomyces sp. NPDC019443 TaxID=3365061 RepID=UPI00379BFC17
MRSRGIYGAPRVHAVLQREGAGCRRTAGRASQPTALTTIAESLAASRPDHIVRSFQLDPTRLDARWCGLRTDPVADALKVACRQSRSTHPVILHSDRGCLYTSRQFAAPADEFGVRLSVGRKNGQYRDNAPAESFFATIKRELLGIAAWPSMAAALAPRSSTSSRAGTTASSVQQPWLLRSRRLRDRTRSLTTTPMVPVTAEQAQR